MIQKERNNLRPSCSLNKISCLPIDKTFPHLISYIQANDSPQSKQKKVNLALRQFDKKFYEDQIKMLLCKLQNMAEKNRALQAEVERLRQEKKRGQSIQQRTIRKTVGQIQCPETIDSISKQKQQENGPISVMNRLKTNYMTQLEKIKVEYEKRLKEKSNLLKSLQYDNYCKTMEMKFEEERLKKQNDELRKQLQSKKNLPEKQNNNHQNEEKVQGVFQIQSYREENALLRSFIYKIQLTEQKLEKLQQSRKKQRKQFVDYAEQSQSEKRQLLKDMEDMKNVYEQKLRLINLNYEQKISAKDLQIKQLQSRLEASNDRMNHIPSSLSQQNKLKKDFEDEKKDLENSQYCHNQWQKMQKSLLRLASEKDQKMEAMWVEIKQQKQKEVLYHQEIQRLRIQRNNIAVENKSLENQLLSIKIEVTNIENQYKRTNLNEQKKVQNQTSRSNQVEQSNGIKRSLSVSSMKLSQWRRVQQLQKALKQQKQCSGNAFKELQMIQSYMKSKQNSMKLTQQMSQNSYKELWQKYSQILLQNAKLKQTIEQLQKEIKIMTNNLSNIQRQHESFKEQAKKEKQLKESECEMLRDQYTTLKYQYDQVMQEVNQRAEEAEVTIYRQSKEIERNMQEIDKLNQKFALKTEEIIQEKHHQNQQIKILRDQLNNVHQRLQIQENNFAAEINEFRVRYEMTQIMSLQLRKNIENLKLQQQKTMQEKQNMIIKLQEELHRKNETESHKPFKKINTLFDTSCHQSRVSNQSNSEIFGTVEYYQVQICQINSHHNHEVECLKQYIRELIAENDLLRQRCIFSVNKWKEMFEGVISYNKFVGHQEEIMEKSIRKRDIIAGSMQSIQNKASVIEQKHIQKYQIDSILQESSIFRDKNNLDCQILKIDQQFPSNSWEVYSVPDFSERKIEQINTQTQNKSIIHRNLCEEMKKSDKSDNKRDLQGQQANHNQENDPNINNCSTNLEQKCVAQDFVNNFQSNQGFYNKRKSSYERFKETR